MLKEYLLKKVLDASFNAIKIAARKVLRDSSSSLLTTREDIEEALNQHFRSINNWSGEVSFNDLKKPKLTTSIYIDLDFFVCPRRVRIYPYEEVESISLRKIFDNSSRHLILLGQPGAGKTTSMKYLCQLLFQDEEFQSNKFSFPILIKFRELNNDKGTANSSLLLEYIYNILGLRIDFKQEAQTGEAIAERKAIKEKLVINFLEELKVLLILEGFDELAQNKRRTEVIAEITTLAMHLSRCTMIVTSRTGDFYYSIDNTEQYEISPLSREQIKTFALKWLNDAQQSSDFLMKVYQSPFADTAIRPLTLAHLCAIYERIGKIPDKPKTIYRKIINLLLEEWDQQRAIKRESKYAQFEVDRKFEFLSHLAYVLTTVVQRTVFSKENLLEVYKEIYYDYSLERNEAKQVVSELESHTGLILQSGYEHFEFAHKSLQEFLTAEYLVKLPSIPDWQTLFKIPNELAIAVTISSNSSDYLSELVMTRLAIGGDFPEKFLNTFLSRLLLERPDFNNSIMLGLSLIILYTRYIQYNVVTHDESKLFNINAMIDQFEDMMSLSLSKHSIDIIRSFYETEYIYEMENNDNICRMSKLKNKKEFRLPALTNAYLPKIIYMRSSMLSRYE